MSTYYRKHFFFCVNKKDSGRKCCFQGGGEGAFEAAVGFLKETGNWGAGKYRASSSGCMGRCGMGPVIAVYPEGIWYTYSSVDDVLKIVAHHLKSGEPLEKHTIDSGF